MSASLFGELWAKRDGEVHEILEGIFLGSSDAAAVEKVLQRWAISHILVVHPKLEEKWPDRFVYSRVGLEDAPTANLLEVLPDALDFLEQVRRKRGRVMVHCTRGISRSPSVVMAFIMLSEKRSYVDAKSFVEQKRQVAYPNPGFQAQLLHFDTIVAQAAEKTWEKRLASIRSKVPRGALTRPGSPFDIREAMNMLVRGQLDGVDAMCRRAADHSTLRESDSLKAHGLFFELLHKYWAVPKDRTLVDQARVVAKRLRNLSKIAPAQYSSLQVVLVCEIEAWIKVAVKVLEAETTGQPAPCYALQAPRSVQDAACSDAKRARMDDGKTVAAAAQAQPADVLSGNGIGGILSGYESDSASDGEDGT